MRITVVAALAALLLSSAVSAATVVTGTVPADPGNVTTTGPIAIPGISSGQSRSFTFEWTGGALVEAFVTHEVQFGYLYYESFVDPPFLNGNEQTLIGDCFFAPGSAPCDEPLASGSVSPGRISGSIRTLPGFDVCAATPLPDFGDPIVNCAERYDTVSAFFEASFDGSSDVAYRLVIGDANAIPEPAAWMLAVAGFGLVGGALRRRRPALRSA